MEYFNSMNFAGVVTNVVFNKTIRRVVLIIFGLVFVSALVCTGAIAYRNGRKTGFTRGYDTGYRAGYDTGYAEAIREELVEENRSDLDSWSWFDLGSD